MRPNEKILENVKKVLLSYDDMKPGDPELDEMKEKTTHDAIMGILSKANIKEYVSSHNTLIQTYEEALFTCSKVSKSIILKRHPKDAYINNYNPEWLFCLNANMDIQICLDFFKLLAISQIINAKVKVLRYNMNICV